MFKIIFKIFLMWPLMIVSATAAIVNIPADFATIQAGVDGSGEGDTILIWPGTYRENVVVDEHSSVLASLFLTTGDFSYIPNTVIDGDSAGSVIAFAIWYDSISAAIGLTLTNGGGMYAGGGVYAQASPTISDNIIASNSASRGGGIFSYGDIKIKNNIIRNNHATVAGGGITSYWGYITAEDNLIVDNSSEIYGGGIHIESNWGAIIKNNIIAANRSPYIGGGIVFYANDVGGEVTGNLIIDNQSAQGASIELSFGTYNLTNNTICNNHGSPFGLVFVEFCEATFNNNILWNNAAREVLVDSGATASITYSDIQGGYDGEGNIDDYPMLVDSANGNYHLLAGSPCIDTGDPDSPVDPDSSRADMGAYYYDHLTSADETIEIPVSIALHQNYPNPFNQTTAVRFELAQTARVTLDIYDLLGRSISKLLDSELAAGGYEINWRADNLASGIYFYKLQAGDFHITKRLTLLK